MMKPSTSFPYERFFEEGIHKQTRDTNTTTRQLACQNCGSTEIERHCAIESGAAICTECGVFVDRNDMIVLSDDDFNEAPELALFEKKLVEANSENNDNNKAGRDNENKIRGIREPTCLNCGANLCAESYYSGTGTGTEACIAFCVECTAIILQEPFDRGSYDIGESVSGAHTAIGHFVIVKNRDKDETSEHNDVEENNEAMEEDDTEENDNESEDGFGNSDIREELPYDGGRSYEDDDTTVSSCFEFEDSPESLTSTMKDVKEILFSIDENEEKARNSEYLSAVLNKLPFSERIFAVHITGSNYVPGEIVKYGPLTLEVDDKKRYDLIRNCDDGKWTVCFGAIAVKDSRVTDMSCHFSNTTNPTSVQKLDEINSPIVFKKHFSWEKDIANNVLSNIDLSYLSSKQKESCINVMVVYDRVYLLESFVDRDRMGDAFDVVLDIEEQESAKAWEKAMIEKQLRISNFFSWKPQRDPAFDAMWNEIQKVPDESTKHKMFLDYCRSALELPDDYFDSTDEDNEFL